MALHTCAESLRPRGQQQAPHAVPPRSARMGARSYLALARQAAAAGAAAPCSRPRGRSTRARNQPAASGRIGDRAGDRPSRARIPRSCHSLPLQDQQSSSGASAAPPPRSNETIARTGSPHRRRVDVGVMPLTRPCVISDCVSLSDKLARFVRAFVSEGCAVDPSLAAVVDEFPPYENSVGSFGAEDDAFPRSDELRPVPAISIMIAGIMALVQCKAGKITIFREIPERIGEGVHCSALHLDSRPALIPSSPSALSSSHSGAATPPAPSAPALT